jgi:agmatinase
VKPQPDPRGQVDPFEVPRFGGPLTFARLPRIDEVERCDVAVVGVPFDAGVTFRPGARFGPQAIRLGSKLLREYNPALELSPFATVQVADAGDISCNPFSIATAVEQIETGARELARSCQHVLALGGDHTIAFPLLRAAHARFGQVALLHFDAHLDTLDSAYGSPYTHGTPFRRASEEGLLLLGSCVHVGIHGPLFDEQNLVDDERLGFEIVNTTAIDQLGVAGITERIRDRVADKPLYISVDIDVLDPGFAPGTGTPEPGGLSSRELLAMLRSLQGLNVVACDIVEVAPAYDHAETTALAAAHVAYELISVIAASGSTG